MERMKSKNIIKPLLWTAFLITSFLACLWVFFLSISVGTAYSVSSWLTTTPQVSALIYRTGTRNPTELASLNLTSTAAAVQAVLTTPVMGTTPEGPTQVSTQKPIQIETPTPSNTAPPTQPPATPTIDMTAVKQAQDAELTPMAANMQDYVNALFNNSTIKNNTGTYFRVTDFQGQSNDPGNNLVTATEMKLSDFILKADIHWQVDNLGGDWAESGCGIIFRADEMGNYYMIYLSLDGRGRLIRKLDGSSVMLGRSTIYDVDRNDGQVKFMLIVEGDRLRYFVDGKVKYDTFSQPQIGKLEWTVVSGNKKGFGTMCEIKNIDVWKMGK